MTQSMYNRRITRQTWIYKGIAILVGVIIAYVAYKKLFGSKSGKGIQSFDDPENGSKSSGSITLPTGEKITNPINEKGYINIDSFPSFSTLYAFNNIDNVISAKEAAAQIRYVNQKNYGVSCEGVAERCSQLGVLMGQSDEFIRSVNKAHYEAYGVWIENDIPSGVSSWFACTCKDNANIISKLKNLH